MYSYNHLSREILCRECKIAPLVNRRLAHLLLFMHKQRKNELILKKRPANTRLQIDQSLIPINLTVKKLKPMFVVQLSGISLMHNI